MQKRYRVTMVALGLALAGAMHIARAEVVVIVSAKSPVSALTAEQVEELFLAKAANFPGGAVAVPIDQAAGSAPREEFYAKVASKNAAQLKAYWSKLVFTGKGKAPKEAGGSAAVKAEVAANPNMIGYIEKDALDGTVKAVLTVK